MTFEQTFGSALNANLHFHALVLDGVYDHDEAVFHSVPAPTTAEVQTVVDRVRARVFQTGSIRSCDGGGC